MLLRKLISLWLLPPALNILVLIVGLLLVRWFRKTGRLLVTAAIASLWLLSTPWFASVLLASIERYPALDIDRMSNEGRMAIVVLGAAHHDRTAEYGESVPNDQGLARLHYAANLHRRTGLPILLTGGPMNKGQDIHSEVMARSLQQEYQITPRWLETKSATTWQNALFSAEILSPEGINEVVLVTHSYHMARAVQLFQWAGFNVTAAPTRMAELYPWQEWRFLLPDASSLSRSASVIHEYIGLLWYSLVSPVGNRMEREIRLQPG